MKSVRIIFFTFIFSLSFSNLSLAQTLLGQFHDWRVYETNRGDKIVCYAISLPIKSEDNVFKKGQSYFMVSNIKNDADEIKVSSGIIYDNSTDVEMSFSSKKFYLFPHKNYAWSNSKHEDIDIIKEMQKLDDFIIRGYDENGKYVSDNYSLIGFKESYYLLKDKCG